MVPVSGLACLAKSHLGNILRFKCRDNYDQGALKHGRGNNNEGPDLCVICVPPPLHTPDIWYPKSKFYLFRLKMADQSETSHELTKLHIIYIYTLYHMEFTESNL